MICIMLNNTIVAGPCDPAGRVGRAALWRAGFTERAGILHSPDGAACGTYPEDEIQEAVPFADGYAIWPAVVEPDAPPDGQYVAGHEAVVGDGLVTLTPIYADVVYPPLEEAQAQAIAQVKAATNALADYVWPRPKAEAVRLEIYPFDGLEQAQYQAFVQDVLQVQSDAADAIRACNSHAELNALLADLRAMYGDDIRG